MFSDVMLMNLFGLNGKVVTGDWEKNYVMRSFIIIQPTKCDSDGQIKENELSVSMWNYGGKEMHIRF